MKFYIFIFCLILTASPLFSSYECLRGTWKLDKQASWNIDNLLKAQGKSWVERQTMTSIDVTQYITADANIVTIKAVTSIVTSTSVLHLDNRERETDNPLGGKMKVRATFLNDGKGISLYSRENGADYHTITRRFCAENGRAMYVEFTMTKDSGEVIQGRRVFRRID